MEFCDYLTQPRHDWRVCSAGHHISSIFWVPCLGHTPFCFSSTQRPVSLSLSLTPSDSNCPSPPVTTHFSTLVREHFQVEAKLASTHLFRFWPWTHLASPIGSQQMAHWAHVLGEDEDAWWGETGRGEALPLHSLYTFWYSNLPPAPRITATWATIDDNVTLLGVLGLTNLVPNPFFPWLAFTYSDNYYAPSLWLLFSRPKSPGLQPFPSSPQFGALHRWIFSHMTQIDICPSQSLALETRHRTPAVIYRASRANYYLLLFFGFKKAGLKSN